MISSDQNKVGILYICTGKYVMFLENFITSAEKYLLPNSRKEYYIFTDYDFKEYTEDRIHIINQNKLGWPFDTLMRFKLFTNIKDKLQDKDYLFFYNANSVFQDYVLESELLPTAEDNWLTGVVHSGYCNMPVSNLNYEKNPVSTAYVDITGSKVYYYYQGALFGGRTPEMLDLCQELSNNVDTDLAKDLIAIWHDESHLNYYFNEIKAPKRLHPYYSYPELAPVSPYIPRNVGYGVKTIQLDKNVLGGHALLRS